MAKNVLETICDDKRIELAQLKKALPLAQFKDALTPSDRSLFDNLSQPECGYVLECKKASPSKGLIRPEFDLEEIIGAYAPYAAGISVLTESKYFQGNYDYVNYVRERVQQPVLNKDFFVEPYQVYLARYHNADAILLMLSVLSDEEYRELAAIAEQYALDILTEVSNQQEVDRAIELGAKIIGINNRNLRDLSTDLQTTRDLAPSIPKDRLVISESGIYSHDQVVELSKYSDGYLVGSSLMAQSDLEMAVRKLVIGENKVCGLTRAEDAKAAYQAGAAYGGLIFAEKSPRYVTLEQAKQVQAGAPLNYVGVFVNADIDQILSHTQALGLAVIQLHGQEDQAYIDALQSKLSEQECTVQIWKAVNPTEDGLPDVQVDRWLLDSGNKAQPGGTGQTFDWQWLADNQIEQAFMLAGGLTPDNALAAAQTGAIGLDLNSGVEDEPGIKSADKISAAFSALRQY